ncbi:MAG: hypothetical protein ACP6IU_01490 [Candidatus Asgardarchaeia archaeon]
MDDNFQIKLKADENVPFGYLDISKNIASSIGVHTGDVVEIFENAESKGFLRILVDKMSDEEYKISDKTIDFLGLSQKIKYTLKQVNKEISPAKQINVKVYISSTNVSVDFSKLEEILYGLITPAKAVYKYTLNSNATLFLKVSVMGEKNAIFSISEEFSKFTFTKEKLTYSFNLAFLIDKSASMTTSDAEIGLDSETLSKITFGSLEIENQVIPYLSENRFPRVNAAFLTVIRLLDDISKQDINLFPKATIITYGKEIFDFVVMNEATYDRLRYITLTPVNWTRLRGNFLRFAYVHMTSASGIGSLGDALEHLATIIEQDKIEPPIVVFVFTDGKSRAGKNPFEVIDNLTLKNKIYLIPICIGSDCYDASTSYLDDLATLWGFSRMNYKNCEDTYTEIKRKLNDTIVRKMLLKEEKE